MKRTLILVTLLILVLSGCSKNNTLSANAGVETSTSFFNISEPYDALLASGDGFNLIVKRMEHPVSPYDMIGIIKNDGTWVLNWTYSHPFIDSSGQLKGTQSYGTIQEKYESCSVLYSGEKTFTMKTGSHMFSDWYSYTVYNIETCQSFDTGECADDFSKTKNIPYFYNGYWVTKTDRRQGSTVKIISTDGRIDMLTSVPSNDSIDNMGIFSEDCFFSYDGFYSSSGEQIISLSQYAGLITNSPHFSNGECTIVVTNPDGVNFEGKINKAGEFIVPLAKM